MCRKLSHRFVRKRGSRVIFTILLCTSRFLEVNVSYELPQVIRCSYTWWPISYTRVRVTIDLSSMRQCNPLNAQRVWSPLYVESVFGNLMHNIPELLRVLTCSFVGFVEPRFSRIESVISRKLLPSSAFSFYCTRVFTNGPYVIVPFLELRWRPLLLLAVIWTCVSVCIETWASVYASRRSSGWANYHSLLLSEDWISASTSVAWNPALSPKGSGVCNFP